MGRPMLTKGNHSWVLTYKPSHIYREEKYYIGQNNPRVMLLNGNQDDEELVRNFQQNNLRGQNNLTHMVENILAQNDLNIGLYRPKFVTTLSEYVLQTKLPRGWKFPKFTKFAGDTSKLIVKHIT